MAQAPRDNNQVTALLGTSNADGITPVPVYVDPSTHRLLVDSNAEGGSGGTQYTEGDTDASITGTAILWEDSSDTLRAVSAANPLPVSASIDPTGLATSAKQDTIIGHLDGVESLLTDIETAVDGLEEKDYATSAKQDTMIGHLDGVEGLLTTIDADTGAIATSVASIDTDTTTIIGHLDGVEGLLTTIDADTGNIATSVDQIEGYIDQIEGYVDGIEGLLTTIDADTSNLNDAIKADDAAFTPGTTKVVMAGFQADETSTDSVDEGDAGTPRMTLDRKQIVTVQPHTAGGLSIFRSLDLDETEEDVKTSAGQLYGWYIYNTASSVRYIKIYNAAATNVTVGTTAPVMTIPIPATSGANVEFTNGIAFSTAICAAATTGVADSDTGAPGANEVIANFLYK